MRKRGRIVIVGGVAAGASAVAKARRTNETAEIVLFEGGPYTSFANCGLPYYVGGEIASRDELFVADPAQFAERFLIDLRVNARVIGVAAADRFVTFVDPSGAQGTLTYDRLILATGTVPIVPRVPGIQSPNVFLCRTVPDVDAIMERLKTLAGGRALVFGGGYIGIEGAEQLLRRSFQVTVVEMQDQLIGPLDSEMAQPVHAAMESAGVSVILSDGVARIETIEGQAKAVLASGRELEFDIAIIGTGVRPNVELARAAGIKLGTTGAIAVDPQQRTSDPAIFAAGDNCEAIFLPTGSNVNIPLAGPANKQGRIAGQNAALDLAGPDAPSATRLAMGGVLGTSIVRFGEVVAGATGLTEKQAKRLGIDPLITFVTGLNHAAYYPGAVSMLLKLLFEKDSGKLLGAQAVGGPGVDKRLDILATALHGGMTAEDLEQLDLCYAPPFGSAKDVVIMGGFISANAHRGTSAGISPNALMQELSGVPPPFLVDVRSPSEFKAGQLATAKNIPLPELRARLAEVPTNRRVVVNCATGLRSYVAQQILLNSGWSDVRNLYGGYRLASRILDERNVSSR
jgi:NADPH-dependent 2,4-dienoyl-CoA reductase/sulfur reductase-like enzyme/rhodanese-related sulfurtransferase